MLEKLFNKYENLMSVELDNKDRVITFINEQYLNSLSDSSKRQIEAFIDEVKLGLKNKKNKR